MIMNINRKNIKYSCFTLAVYSLMLLGLNSCYDNKMEWEDPYNHPETKELPLELQEKISRYSTLNTYANFNLGVGIDFKLYMTDETYRNIINQNFKEVTAGNEMKQTALMNGRGELNFSVADELVNQLRNAGMAIYGHVLVWHSQQQAAYFDGLIAPTIIMPPAGSNLLNNGSFEDDFLASGWNSWGGSWEIVSEDALDGDKMLKVTAGGGTDAWATQVRSERVPTVIGHQYEVSFFIRSEGAGEMRLSIGSDGQMSNRWPPHQDAVVGRPNNVVATSAAWKQIVFSSNTIASASPWVATGESVQFDFDLGQVPGMVYYIDNVIVTDLDAEVDGNLLPAGGFESGDLEADGWQAKNKGAGIEITTEEVRTGKYAVKLIASATSANDWDLQLGAPSIPVVTGNQYEISFYIKSNVAGKGRLSFGSSMSNNYPWVSGQREFTTSTNWERVVYSPETIGDTWATTRDALQIDFDLGTVPDVIYYIDDVTVLDVTPAAKSSAFRASPTVIEKTPEEKFAILEPVFINYITDVATHFKGKVAAWDVVNEPMNDNGSGLKTGIGATLNSDHFFWQDYLGKNYAVTAFKTAKAADPDAKLFINDYNLESPSGSKLQGLIDYVKYIEENGGQVDGIGTQLHLNINWTSNEGIELMFQKLGTTGKLIKITELDIAVASSTNPESPVSPTLEQYARQADLYKHVVDMYKKYIPEAQRHSITVWGVSDNEDEHTFWLKNDAPCLWDAKYQRKHAYKGFADGLAGKDVSADFSGELVY